MEIKIVRSSRKTVSIQINQDLSVVVRAPRWVSKRELDLIIKEKEPWIIAQVEKLSAKKAAYEANRPTPLTTLELNELADQALAVIPERVKYYAPIVGVNYGRITIRNQRTRWGSCSGKGNLNFNCLLMKTSPEIIDYVVVHELCHRKEMNHSAAFWKLVENVLPDYRERRKWLRDHGQELMALLGE